MARNTIAQLMATITSQDAHIGDLQRDLRDANAQVRILTELSNNTSAMLATCTREPAAPASPVVPITSDGVTCARCSTWVEGVRMVVKHPTSGDVRACAMGVTPVVHTPTTHLPSAVADVPEWVREMDAEYLDAMLEAERYCMDTGF